jgi:hypothetical protein
MLINDQEQFLKAQFDNEAEIDGIVQKYSEQLFGSSSIYLPKTKITTSGGRGTIPDAFVIDVQSEEWFLVEAERAVHGTWEHIAPQISKQLAAVSTLETRELLLQIALNLIASNRVLRDIFQDLGIGELEIHGKLQKILRKPPTIAIPIDRIPKDLTEWVQTLKNNTKIWVIEKYVSTTNPNRVLYSFPDENLPTLTTISNQGADLSSVRATGSQPFQEVLDAGLLSEGQVLLMDYGPRGSDRRTFQGIVRKEGIEVEGKVYSPSYAAVRCIQQAGSSRTTANGWIMWKTQDGEYLTDLYEKLDGNEDESTISSDAT